MKRGKFITFEGPEGSGKSTQARILYEKLMLEGQKAVLTREPGGVPEAEAIRSILKSEQYHLSSLAELYLFSACREMFVSRIVRPNIEKGIHVISDRFADSTRAYQGYAGGINMDTIEKLIHESTGGLNPDMTVIIDVDVKLGLSKETEGGRFSQKSADYHEKVRQGYLDLARKNAKRYFVIERAEGQIIETYKKIREVLHKRLSL